MNRKMAHEKTVRVAMAATEISKLLLVLSKINVKYPAIFTKEVLLAMALENTADMGVVIS